MTDRSHIPTSACVSWRQTCEKNVGVGVGRVGGKKGKITLKRIGWVFFLLFFFFVKNSFNGTEEDGQAARRDGDHW